MRQAFCHYSVSTGWSLFRHFEMLGSVIFFMGWALCVFGFWFRSGLFGFSWDSPFHLQSDSSSLASVQTVCSAAKWSEEAKEFSTRIWYRGLWDIVLSYIWFCISRAKGMSKAWDGFLQIFGVYWLDIQIGFVWFLSPFSYLRVSSSTISCLIQNSLLHFLWSVFFSTEAL